MNLKGDGEIFLESDQIVEARRAAERMEGIRTVWTIVGIHITASYCPSVQHCESQVSRVDDSHL